MNIIQTYVLMRSKVQISRDIRTSESKSPYMKLHSFRQDLQDHQDLLDLILLYPVHPVDPVRKWKFMPLSFLFD